MRLTRLVPFALLTLHALHASAWSALDTPLLAAAQAEVSPMLGTMSELVGIESGSHEPEKLKQIADVLAARLKALGAEVEILSPGEPYRMEDTPDKIGSMVRATWRGRGSRSLLLIAHMDTVYPAGLLAQQPFSVRGDRAYGLGIADDKQGLALVLHTLALLKARGFDDYGRISVLFNGDEEISSPGSRRMIARMGAEHDAVMSFEGSGIRNDRLSLATAGIASARLKVAGRAAHAGSGPGMGVNALYELAHQVLQMSDLSDVDSGVRVNWTMAKAGIVRNMIPPEATAEADIRVLRVRDYANVESAMRERMQKQLLPEARVSLVFERRRPPMEATPASEAFATHAVGVYKELGRELEVEDEASGGGTDAAFAAMQAKGPVVERFGLQGSGAHTRDAEYILVSSIAPRLYLVVRMIEDFSRGLVSLPPDLNRTLNDPTP